MRSVQVSKSNGPFEIDRDVPEPSGKQVRIRVQACGICHGDSVTKDGILQQQDWYLLALGEIVVDLAAYVILLWDINICCDKGAWRKSIRYLKLINKRYNKIVK